MPGISEKARNRGWLNDASETGIGFAALTTAFRVSAADNDEANAILPRYAGI